MLLSQDKQNINTLLLYHYTGVVSSIGAALAYSIVFSFVPLFEGGPLSKAGRLFVANISLC
jgi:hypothetical protein